VVCVLGPTVMAQTSIEQYSRGYYIAHCLFCLGNSVGGVRGVPEPMICTFLCSPCTRGSNPKHAATTCLARHIINDPCQHSMDRTRVSSETLLAASVTPRCCLKNRYIMPSIRGHLSLSSPSSHLFLTHTSLVTVPTLKLEYFRSFV